MRSPVSSKSKPPSPRDNHPVSQLAASRGIRIRNPKDYVILMGNRVLDGRRVVTIEIGLPPQLSPGMELEYRPASGEPSMVAAVKDFGDTVEVAFKDTTKTNQVVERCHLFSRYNGPTKPELVHKSRLAKIFGEKLASMFWDSKLRMRVPYMSHHSKVPVTKVKPE